MKKAWIEQEGVGSSRITNNFTPWSPESDPYRCGAIYHFILFFFSYYTKPNFFIIKKDENGYSEVGFPYYTSPRGSLILISVLYSALDLRNCYSGPFRIPTLSLLSSAAWKPSSLLLFSSCPQSSSGSATVESELGFPCDPSIGKGRYTCPEMAFRGREMMKKVLKRVGEENLAPGVRESLEKCIPKSKIVMGRANRGIFAGRHIRFGNRVSEDGGNK